MINNQLSLRQNRILQIRYKISVTLCTKSGVVFAGELFSLGIILYTPD